MVIKEGGLCEKLILHDQKSWIERRKKFQQGKEKKRFLRRDQRWMDGPIQYI